MKFRTLLIMLFIGIGIISSCNESTNTNELKFKKNMYLTNFQDSLSFLNHKGAVRTYLYEDNSHIIKDIRINLQAIDINNYIQNILNISPIGEPVSLIFFGYSDTLSYDTNSTQAIGYYYKIDSVMYHKLFKKINGQYQSVDKYSCVTNSITFNVIHHFIETETNLLNNNEITLTVIKNGNLNNTGLSSYYDELFFRYLIDKNNSFRQSLLGNPISICECKKHCPRPCESQEGNYKCEYWGATGYTVCVPRDGGSSSEDQTCVIPTLYNNFSNDTNKLGQIQTNLYYNFRDNILAKSSIARYTFFYYYMSYKIRNHNNISIDNQFVDVLSELNPILIKLSDIHTYKNDMLFTTTAKNKITNLLNNLKVLDNDVYFKNLIEEVKADVNVYSNLTIGDFANAIDLSY